MTSNPRRAKGGGWAVLALVLVILPVVYVLGIGPAIFICDAGYIEFDYVRTAYEPLIKLAWKWEPTGQILARYVAAWRLDRPRESEQSR
jgi:hypothetical protein